MQYNNNQEEKEHRSFFTGVTEIDQYIISFLHGKDFINMMSISKRMKSLFNGALQQKRNDPAFSTYVNNLMYNYIEYVSVPKPFKLFDCKLSNITELLLKNYHIIAGSKYASQSAIGRLYKHNLIHIDRELFNSMILDINMMENEMNLKVTFQESIVNSFIKDESITNYKEWLQDFLDCNKNYDISKWHFEMITTTKDIKPLHFAITKQLKLDPLIYTLFVTRSCLESHRIYNSIISCLGGGSYEFESLINQVRNFIKASLQRGDKTIDTKVCHLLYLFMKNYFPMDSFQAQDTLLKLAFPTASEYPVEYIKNMICNKDTSLMIINDVSSEKFSQLILIGITMKEVLSMFVDIPINTSHFNFGENI